MNELNNFFKKFKHSSNGPLFGFGTTSEADWKIIFFSATTLIVLIGIISAFMFVKINRGEIFVVEETETMAQNTLDIDKLRKTNLYYQNKALEFEMIKNAATSSPVFDPSI